MKTVVITGATSGIGLAIVKALVTRNDYVIAVGRSIESCDKAYKNISEKELPNLVYLPCDLANQKEIHNLSKKIKSLLKDKGLDVLINNAGLVSRKRLVNDENIELLFAVNHLAGFLLTHLLLRMLKKKSGMVISTGSRSHYKSILDFDNLMLEKGYKILKAYGRSKLCNTFFAYEFNRRFLDEGLISYCLDPGMVKTPIGGKQTNRFIAWVWRTYTRNGQYPVEVAPHYLELIDNPRKTEGPYYYKHGKFIEPSEYSKRADISKKLWNISLELTKIEKFD